MTVDAARGGAYDRIGRAMEKAGVGDSSGARRAVFQMLTSGEDWQISRAAEYVKLSREEALELVENVPPAERKCAVCGKPGSLTTASSRIGPISLEYCHTCLVVGAEPIILIANVAAVVGGVNGLNALGRSILGVSLEHTGTTMDEFEKKLNQVLRSMYP